MAQWCRIKVVRMKFQVFISHFREHQIKRPLQMFNKSVYIWGVKWRTVYNLHFRFCVATESLVLVLLKHNLQSFVDSAMLGLSTTPWLAFWSFALLGILRSDLLWLGDFEIISKCMLLVWVLVFLASIVDFSLCFGCLRFLYWCLKT